LADEKSAVLYAMDKGLIPSFKNCPAGHALQFSSEKKKKFQVLQMPSLQLQSIKLTNTWFEKSRLSVADNLKFMYMWAHRDKQHRIISSDGRESFHDAS
jgi:hypothetical protein